MGFLDNAFKGAQQAIGQFTGFGGYGSINPQEVDPSAYENLFNQALTELQGVGKTGQMGDIRKKLESSTLSQLEGLDNNAAGRKKNYLEDMSRNFSSDTQNLARAKGGTGSLAQALRPSGSMYDSQARAVSRGLVDLQGQAIQDLAGLSGVQGNLYGQDLGKAKSLADVYTGELAQRRGIAKDNADARYNANTERYNRQKDTINQASKIGSYFVGGGGG